MLTFLVSGLTSAIIIDSISAGVGLGITVYAASRGIKPTVKMRQKK